MRALLSFALVIGALPLAAWAEPVLLPAGPLEADGRERLVELFLDEPGLPEVRALRGVVLEVRPGPDGGVLVRYRTPRVAAPVEETLVVGGRVRLPLPLVPSGGVRLQLTVAPSPLVLGKGAAAEVRVLVRDTAGRPARAALRLGASVGKLAPPVEAAPGEYHSVYTPPEERFPQVAILGALSVADGAFALSSCRLAARVTVNGEGEPGGSMSIVVDGRSFGPAAIGADGRFALPIVVPPGGRAIGTSTDTLGNQQRREIDLQLPSFPRLVVTAVPRELVADGRARAEVMAFAVDARGNPAPRAAPSLSADRGALGPPVAHGDGSTTWTLTAPDSVGDGKVALRAGIAEVEVALRPAPPFFVEVVPPAEPLGAGVEVAQAIEVHLRDRGGAPVAGAELSAQLVGGHVVGVDEAGPGRYLVQVVPPRDPGRGLAALHVEVTGLRAGPPRRVTLHALPPRDGRLGVEAWVDDDLGAPVPSVPVELEAPGATATVATDRFGTARIEFKAPPSSERRFAARARLAALPGLEATVDYLRVGGALRAVSGVRGQGVALAGDPPAAASADVELPLRPAAPVDLRLTVTPPRATPAERAVMVAVQLVDGAGHPSDGELLYQASAGRLDVVRPLQGGAAELRFVPPASAAPGTRFVISVTEAKSRVTAFVEVVAP